MGARSPFHDSLGASEAPGDQGHDPASATRDPAFYKIVAMTYQHYSTRRGGALAVTAEAFAVSPRTVSRWLAKARDQGLLPPARSGHAAKAQQQDPMEISDLERRLLSRLTEGASSEEIADELSLTRERVNLLLKELFERIRPLPPPTFPPPASA